LCCKYETGRVVYATKLRNIKAFVDELFIPMRHSGEKSENRIYRFEIYIGCTLIKHLAY